MIEIDRDTVGRMVIRLSRAYKHGWATGLPEGAVWDWKTMSEAVFASMSSRKPVVDDWDASVRASKDASTWVVSPQKVRIDFMERQDSVGFVELDWLDNGPAIRVAIDLKNAHDTHRWRVGRAVTSLACGPWQEFIRLPTVGMVADSFGEAAGSGVTELVYRLVGTHRTPVIWTDPSLKPEFARQLATWSWAK